MMCSNGFNRVNSTNLPLNNPENITTGALFGSQWHFVKTGLTSVRRIANIRPVTTIPL